MLFEIYFSYFNIIDLVIDCYYMSFTGLNVLVAPLLTFSSFLIVSIEYIFFQIQNIFLLKLISFNILNVAFKFIVLIALLIFVRGGIPRYRYDFLTKVGWIKFLSLILSIFLSSLLLILLF